MLLLSRRINYTKFTKKFHISYVHITLLSALLFSVFALAFNLDISTQIVIAQSDPILGIATTGDIKCENPGKKTINKIEEYQANGTVDKVLWLGDLSYDITQECFFEESNQLPVKDTLAVVGNHDDPEDGAGDTGENRELRKQTLEKYGLPAEGYYSRTWNVTGSQSNSSNDVLVIGMDTVESAKYGEDSKQFEFIESTLKNNSELEKPAPLVIVMMHKPMVSCTCKHPNGGEKLPEADTYHPLFKKFGVDLVLQGHNHNVQYYEPIDGVMYILSGSGGAGKHDFDNNEKFPRDFPDDDISIKYDEADTFGFTLLEANFDTFELKGSLISNRGTPISNSNFTMQFSD